MGTATDGVTLTVSKRALERTMDLFLGHHRHSLKPGDEVPGYVMNGLEPEGEPMSMPELLPVSILISNEMAFERPLRLGETLTARTRMADISERFGGQFGYSITFRTEVEFSDASGAIVARTARTMMQYDAKGGSGEAAP